MLQAPQLPDFADEEMVSICKEIGAPLDPEHRDRLRKRLVEAGAFYRMSTDSFAETRRGQSGVRGEAQRLAKAASVLAGLIEQMRSRTKFSAAARSGKLAERHGDDWFNRTKPGLQLDECQEEGVDQLASRAGTQFFCDLKGVYRLEAGFWDLARAPSGDKGGRVRDRARESYIKQLARIYEETTGNDAHYQLTYDRDAREYSGPFYSLVKRNLKIVRPDRDLENRPLGDLIRSVLPKRPEKTKPRRVRAKR